MSTKQRPNDRGVRQARHLLRVLGDELRHGRSQSGLSQASLGRATGVSGQHVSRIERGEVPGAAVALYARLFAVLGMRLSARPYPDGDPLRDTASARLLRRFQGHRHPTVVMRTEVRLGREGDLRAWDAQLATAVGTCKVEAETVLYDLQAQVRRLTLKMDDDGADVVILLVAGTHRNRRVLREFRDLIRNQFPLDTRNIMASLRAGRLPDQSGVVVL
jgi:transcriptional regulator with XRE-family HTH domain